MIVDEERASAAKDATDLSAEYRGLYGFAHIGVWPGGRAGDNPLLDVAWDARLLPDVERTCSGSSP